MRLTTSVRTAAVLAATMCLAAGADAARITGRITNAENAEPISAAAVQLTPADSTGHRTGAMTNSDGSFWIEAPAGRYTVRVLAQGFGSKDVPGVTLADGTPQEIHVTLGVAAIQQQEVVVEADAKRSGEGALLAERRKASTVGDAVSAEQIKRTPDGDAGQSLRRVTGLNTQGQGHVFVRGMGERYSSTQIDGVRVASPESNRRVVPLDIVPAALVDHVVVQKTYTADRPGEFGGGDVQVVTKDFPGHEVFTLTASQGWDEGTTLHRFRTYSGSSSDWLGFGVQSRALPTIIDQVGENKRVIRRGLDPAFGFPMDSLATIATSFSDVWSPSVASTAAPSGSVAQSYGNEWALFGRPLGFTESATWSRSTEAYDQVDRDYRGALGSQQYDYAVTHWNETARLGGVSALSYRLGRGHTVHLRGLYSRTGEDEVTSYAGYVTANDRNVRGTRLDYIARTIANASLSGKHEIEWAFRPRIEWQATLSSAVRDEPDRRETLYEGYQYLDDDDSLQTVWSLSGSGVGAMRSFGHMTDEGKGATATLTVPLDARGLSKIQAGASVDQKDRESIVRRFLFVPATGDQTAIPESLFQAVKFTGKPGGAEVKEVTRPDDNYLAHQLVSAGFVSADLAVTHRVRTVLGARLEEGVQDVSTYDIFSPDKEPIRGMIDHLDLLPTANVTIGLSEATNLRLGAARTISRPDLRELTPGPTFEILGHLPVIGNPSLRRASITNYDVRLERFPTANEVIAVGAFYKRFVDPIEYVVRGGDTPVLQPNNSDSGRNYGVEVELRTSLGRVSHGLDNFFLNGNATLLSSRITLAEMVTTLGSSDEHPLEGQASSLYNVALSFASRGSAVDASVLVNRVGRRLANLGLAPLPDQYAEPITTLDATASWRVSERVRMKLAAKNLLDAQTVSKQGDEVSLSYRTGRTITLGATLGQ